LILFAEHRLLSQFFDTFIRHSLIHDFIELFDDSQLSKFSELITELFVNISAISPQFWDIFMPDHNFLFCNTFSRRELRDYVLQKCIDFKYYLDRTHSAIQSSDYQTLVLMSLLIAGATPGKCEIATLSICSRCG
jgi:hypothetical protein